MSHAKPHKRPVEEAFLFFLYVNPRSLYERLIPVGYSRTKKQAWRHVMATQPVEVTNPIETVQPIPRRTRRRTNRWVRSLRRAVSRLIFNALPFVIVLGFLWLQ